MSTMRAAVLHDLHDLRVEDVPKPTYGANDVLIEVSYNGLCGTDASEFAKGQIMVPLKIHTLIANMLDLPCWAMNLLARSWKLV